MDVVGPDELRFRDFPGRTTSDPFKEAGRVHRPCGRWMIESSRPGLSLHPQSEEIVYVVAGTGRVWLDGVFHSVGPGSWYRIPARTPHATMADQGERLSLVCFFPHDDFPNNIEELDIVIEADQEAELD